jgi:hypothetical protein
MPRPYCAAATLPTLKSLMTCSNDFMSPTQSKLAEQGSATAVLESPEKTLVKDNPCGCMNWLN